MIVSVFAKHAGRNKRCLKTSLIVFFVVTIFPLRPAVFIFRQTALGASGWSCLDLPGPSLFALGLREVWILRRRSDSCHPCILEERRRSRKSSSQQRTMNTGWIRRMSQRTKEEQTLCLQAEPRNNRVFSLLQKYNRHGLLVPVGADHMWNAAMESKFCRLTLLGKHYRRLADQGLL